MDTELCNIGIKTTVPFAATSGRRDSDRRDRQKNMVEKLTELLGKLAITKSWEGEQKFCTFVKRMVI